MRDALEERLATTLRTLGETVDDELVPPVDLELQVARRRRRTRSTRRVTSLAVAAAVVAALATVAAVHGTTGSGTPRIATSSTSVVPLHDALQPGTVMLSARGAFVISLDDRGVQNATMVRGARGNQITYARATDDHRTIWYLSLKNGPHACGDVVRANIDGKSSKIVTQAEAFDVSPDGTRLALYGAGNLANGQCSPVKAGATGEIAIVDVATFESSTVAIGDVTSLRWSPDGAGVLAVRCGTFGCGLQKIAVPVELGAALHAQIDTQAIFKGTQPGSRESIAFGPDGLYVLDASTSVSSAGGSASATETTSVVQRYDARTLRSPVPVFDGGTDWHVAQVVPTTAGTYVVATPVAPVGAKVSAGLYRVVGGKLALVEHLSAPGTLTPVAPLGAAPTG